MILRFFLLASVFLLAFCVSIERNNPDDPGSNNYYEEREPSSSSSNPFQGNSSNSGNSSSLGSSSNSVSSSSSVQSGIIYGESVEYGGETYKTVVIGNQTWFQRNLNYANGDSYCYNNDQANCATYGRLYDWATAMGFSYTCNVNSCSSLISAEHKGICPDGWHIPSDADWNVLMKFVNPSCSDNSTCAGVTKLNTYGFAALPGGRYMSNFQDIGKLGFWWITLEYNEVNSYYRDFSENILSRDYGGKGRDGGNLKSIRCVQNSEPPSSSSTSSSSSAEPLVGTSGIFTDERDDNPYNWVKIGEQYWMAENLNFAANNSKCYGDDESSCTIYGRLYNWATAMALPSSCNQTFCISQIGAKHKGVCPDGWHIPSNTDWNVLMRTVNPSCFINRNCTGAGAKLKATNRWSQFGNGEDTYGFAALPGSYGYLENNSYTFINIGYTGYWWSTTEYYASSVCRREMNYHSDDVNLESDGITKSGLVSVRCVKD